MKRTPLERKKPLKRSTAPRKPRAISPASREQRAKANLGACLVTGMDRYETTIDPAHLASRAHGGCDDPLCVVPLSRGVHMAFDRGEFDLLPYLIAHGCVDELAHALGHYRGDLLGLAARLTGVSWVPAERRAA
jgi:hypothetical protein